MNEPAKQLLSLRLPCNPEAPAKARHAMGGLEALGWIAGDVMLVISELVTNAVLHSGCLPDDELDVRASQHRDRVTITVRDPGLSRQTARLGHEEMLGPGGWGLRLVEQLAESWGQERDDGYRVWADIRLPDDPGPPPRSGAGRPAVSPGSDGQRAAGSR